jgi:hypothetical protein
MCLKSNNNSSIWGQLKPHLWGIVWGIDTGYDVTGNDVTGSYIPGSCITGNEREIISHAFPGISRGFFSELL